MFCDALKSNTTEKKVLSRIIRRGAASRKEISEELGVTTATLTRVVSSLMEQGLVHELGAMDEGRVGRKQILLDIASNLGYVVGFDVTNLYLRLTLMDLHANIMEEKNWVFPSLSQDVLDEAIQQGVNWINAYTPSKILGIGLLLQGYLNGNSSLSLAIPNISEQLESRLGIRPFVMNNVRGLAVAESYLGNPCKNYLLIKYGPGVGSVIVQNGELWCGNSNRAGEIGHIAWRSSSPVSCPICGKRGCLETQVGYRAIIHQSTPEMDTQYPDLETVLLASERDNGTALKKALHELAKAVNMMIDIIDPEQVVLAGQLFQRDEYYNYFSQQISCRSSQNVIRPLRRISDYERKRRSAAGIIVLNHYFG